MELNNSKIKIKTKNLNVYYGAKQALFDINLDINQKEVTALIGPSGCGKSTFIRCINRMNDVIDICKVEGSIQLDGNEINEKKVDVVTLREKVGTYSSLYKTSSDALIGLERYKDAEINALLAHINGENSIANYINLASLAAMRKDQLMAKKWLSFAEKIDKGNDLVVQCKGLLFPQGKSREEDSPFNYQI